MFNYGTLIGPKSTTGSIRSWINYDPLDVEGVLLDAQAYLYGRIRVREMIASATVTIAKSASTVALPTGFLDPILLRLPDGTALAPKSPAELERLRPRYEDGTLEESTPTAYSVFDELVQLDVKADAAYAGSMLFYKQPTALGRTNQTNFLTTRYPNLLRACCLMHGADQMQDDEQYAKWKQRTDELVATLSVENDLVARGRDYSVSVR